MGTAPKPPKPPPLDAVKVGVGDMVLGRYRVVEQIASGGHSVVFRGTDERLSRPVCIKVFSGLGGQSGVGRTSYEHFVQEAFALSRLTHPNTLRIYDFGHLGGGTGNEGMPLQVCEFMNGGTLSNVVREQGVQSISETARIIGAMCAALSEAHALGIVHRDIKPQNILFGSVGLSKLPKLADFGIAKWSADESEQENRAEDTAIVAGQKLAMYSPSWAAPEQLAGQPVSAATDIYSLAVVAVYMMSGKAVFADEDVYAGYKKRRHADTLVREALTPHGVPKQMIELLSKALAFDPKERLSDVDELARALLASITEPKPSARVPEDLPLTPTTPVSAITPPSGTTTEGVAEPQYPPRPSNTPPPTAMSSGPPRATSGWTPPTPRPPWMNTATPTHAGAPQRIALSDLPQPVAERRIHFLHSPTGVADLVGGQGSKVRITYLSSPTHARLIHIKGLSCFIAHVGGRPSPAVTLEQPSDIALVTPRAQEIGHLRVTTGVPDANPTTALIFPIGADRVAVAVEDCTDPILFDFGPGSDAYFVYTRGRTIPKTVHRRR
ncbi:MAG: serine/threonine protein kinase [Deltaproteobacteria bacterium]|nr:serine/threonine protein kinase [Deltaproteobacteria bacterium]